MICIIIVIILVIINGIFGPIPEPKCNMCKDSGYIESNIWYDEVITIDCPKCKNSKL